VSALRLDLKIAILKSGRTQRRLSTETHIPEIRLSNIVRGIACPNSTERTALANALGEDYFTAPAAPDTRSARR
jgi:hypothetical protein